MEQGSYSLDAATFASSLGSGTIEFPNGFAVMTQTCDIVRDHGELTVVDLVRLSAQEQADYGGGKSPRFCNVSDDLYADFERIAVVSQVAVAATNTHDLDASAARSFREAAGRKFGRAPIPTHVDQIMRPLRDWFKRRADKVSYAGMIERVREIRVSIAPDWLEDTDKEHVELTFLFEPGDLAFPGEYPVTPGVANEIDVARDLPPSKALVKLANLLSESVPGSADDAVLWEATAEQFARLLYENAAKVSEGPRVASFAVTALTKDDMTVAQFERTERLDLAHLSTDDR